MPSKSIAIRTKKRAGNRADWRGISGISWRVGAEQKRAMDVKAGARVAWSRRGSEDVEAVTGDRFCRWLSWAFYGGNALLTHAHELAAKSKAVA